MDPSILFFAANSISLLAKTFSRDFLDLINLLFSSSSVFFAKINSGTEIASEIIKPTPAITPFSKKNAPKAIPENRMKIPEARNKAILE